jgi:hypothetical protein
MIHRVPSERSFGLSVGGVCLLLASWLWWRGSDTTWMIFASVGVVLAVSGAVAPSLLRGPNKVWWRFAQVLGFINSRIILGLFFALVLTPVGIVMRVFGRNPLHAMRGPTNWGVYPSRIRNPRHYERMF